MIRFLSLFLAILSGCATHAVAQTTRVTVRSQHTPGSAAWLGGSALQTRVVVGADGQTYVAVWLDAPSEVAPSSVRAPMALSLVVDTSGSMSGAKIEHARLAASSLLEALSDGDIVSIYAFSNQVTEIAPPTVVGPNTRSALMTRAQGLYAAGGTNMYGGVSTGIQRVSTAPQTHTVRRVVLISDGHANIGPSDAGSLGILAGNGTEHGVQVTGIGVGLDYDENTLGSLAVRSSGRLYHLEHPRQMASILQQEVQLLGRTVATNAFIEITPAPGVRILEGVSVGATVQDNKIRMPIGSIYAGQRREVLFRAQVDTRRAGSRRLANAELVYEMPGQSQSQRQEAVLRYEVTRSASAAQNSTAPRVQTIVANVQAAEAERQAAVALNSNDRVTADRHYEFAEQNLVQAVEAAPAAQRPQVQQRLDAVRSNRQRASSAMTAGAARSVALESWDDAMESSGY